MQNKRIGYYFYRTFQSVSLYILRLSGWRLTVVKLLFPLLLLSLNLSASGAVTMHPALRTAAICVSSLGLFILISIFIIRIIVS